MIFRYPGSKAKYAPLLIQHMQPILKSTFTDVFVGGGSMLCAVAHNRDITKLRANDLDETMFSFWKLIERNNPKEVRQLKAKLKVNPTVDLFKTLRSKKPKDLVDKAYRAVFFNRTTFSGIATSAPIGGFGQHSKYKIDCRYNASEMIRKIDFMLGLFSGRLVVTNLDFQEALVDDGMYLDPPYFEKGGQLYPKQMSEADHARLAKALDCSNNWLLSYDDHPEIRKLYKGKFITTFDGRYSISGRKEKGNGWAKKQELVITDYKTNPLI